MATRAEQRLAEGFQEGYTQALPDRRGFSSLPIPRRKPGRDELGFAEGLCPLTIQLARNTPFERTCDLFDQHIFIFELISQTCPGKATWIT
jgi:hypothetical protein